MFHRVLALVCAILVCLAGYLLAVSGASSTWPQDQQQRTTPPSLPPHTTPLPHPRDDDYLAAMSRARSSGRPLVLLFKSDSCQPCRAIMPLLPLLRLKGELGVVDVNQQRDVYEQCVASYPIPCVVLYGWSSGKWVTVASYLGSDVIRDWLVPTKGQTSALPAGVAVEETKADVDQQRSQKDEEVSLLVVYDGSAPCVRMLPVFKQLEAAGFKVVYANATDPKNRALLERFSIDLRNLPYMATYRGHEAMEVLTGETSFVSLVSWLHTTEEGKRAVGAHKADTQNFLKSSDRPFLHQYMAPGSCGMLGCWVHGGGLVTEAVDAQGKPIPQAAQSQVQVTAPGVQVRVGAGSCPNCR